MRNNFGRKLNRDSIVYKVGGLLRTPSQTENGGPPNLLPNKTLLVGNEEPNRPVPKLLSYPHIKIITPYIKKRFAKSE